MPQAGLEQFAAPTNCLKVPHDMTYYNIYTYYTTRIIRRTITYNMSCYIMLA